ncbi:uncharacterized protein LOC105388064 [Plutella xylostella]|uniref:uncharacterized protein LOC105388064 n=1 Tax=Plutella xylostella TaxID=51655 RepID=UPI002032E0DB|nr:uncharacterized protein LOC105388064 [Plutella xylostella]
MFEPKEEIPEYKHPHYDKEVLAGNMADLFTSNRHYEYPNKYDDLSRRADNIIVPIEAPLDVVLQVAEQAALMPPAVNPDEFVVDKKALRSGNYWDSYYKEDGIIDVLNPASYPSRSGIKRNVDENSEDSGSDTVYEDLSDNHNPHVLASTKKSKVYKLVASILFNHYLHYSADYSARQKQLRQGGCKAHPTGLGCIRENSSMFSSAIPQSLKTKVFNQYVLPVMKYDAET